jgi:copper chaperone
MSSRPVRWMLERKPDIQEGKMAEITYVVPDMSCGHCKAAVTAGLAGVAGVREVDVDLESKQVVVHGDDLDDALMRAAISEAGYEAA